VDADGEIGLLAHFGHAGNIDVSEVCIIMNE